MSHCCHHGHSHAPPAGVSARKMSAAVVLTLALVAGEVLAGWWSHSLALLGDAGHNFADAMALIFSAYALWIAAKPSNAEMTFGYHRVGILAAFGNAVFLIAIALGIGFGGLQRLQHPQPVAGTWMAIAAAAAIAINLLIGLWLHAGSKHDLNVRGAYLHMMADALSAMGVVAAGIMVRLTGWTLVDPLVSLAIAALILYSSWGILLQSLRVLLEGTPAGLDMRAVQRAIGAVAGVLNVHDLHVWTVGPGAIACSCHVLVDETQSSRQGQQITRDVSAALQQAFGITHTTVQVEVEDHPPGNCCAEELYCSMAGAGRATEVSGSVTG